MVMVMAMRVLLLLWLLLLLLLLLRLLLLLFAADALGGVSERGRVAERGQACTVRMSRNGFTLRRSPPVRDPCETQRLRARPQTPISCIIE